MNRKQRRAAKKKHPHYGDNPVTCVDPRGLIPCHGNKVWYTPMYFREEWHFRRVWAQMDRLFSESTKDRQ